MRAEYCYAAVFILLSAAVYFMLYSALTDSIKHRAVLNTKKRNFKGKSKVSSKIEKAVAKREALINQSDMPQAMYWLLTAIGAVGGFMVGKVIYGSFIIAAAVSVIGMIAPLLYMSFRQTQQWTIQTERLCSSMMILTNSYLSTDDFITSVKENIQLLDYPEPFRDFLTYVTLMDSDVCHGLRRMEKTINSPYFSQWIDALVLAQKDRSIKYVCTSVVDSMHDVISAQQESDAAMYAVWRDYLLTLIMIFSIPLVFKFLMNEAYITLTTSFGGQAIFLLLLAAVVVSVLWAMKINKPIIR